MSIVAVVLLVVLIWVGKQVLGSLVGQQARGSIPVYAAKRARAAAGLLPPSVANDYLEDWLAELAALEAKPFSTIRFAHGLQRAARGIAAVAGSPVAATRRQLVANRAVDMVATTLILVLLAPMFVTIGLVLKLSRPGAVFFRQTRIGRNGAFGMLRFGSWRHSPGLLSIDRTLEESGLAALPTLINVLRGELSLIGPPPHPADDRGLSTIDGRSALGFRPGLFSWQLLVAAGAVQMTIDEAKLRDAERGVGNDLKLMWYSARGALYRR